LPLPFPSTGLRLRKARLPVTLDAEAPGVQNLCRRPKREKVADFAPEDSTTAPELNCDLVKGLVICPLNNALETNDGHFMFVITKMSVKNHA
jgi:hypothetical protein